jgi:hypothetical protein
MNIVETIAPIAIEDLKKYFVDKSTLYIIDYSKSQIKEQKLLTYLSNLEIPCDMDLSKLDASEMYELLKSYMETTMVVNLLSLELLAIDVLKEAKGLNDKEVHKEFISVNKELIDSWISKLDSLTLYNMYSINNDEFQTFAKQFPEDQTRSLNGINFISLLKNAEFYDFYKKIETDKLKFYTNYFNDYMFKGKNLYHYWANQNNPLFLLTYGIAEGLVSSADYITAKTQDIQELANVPSI